MDFHPFALVRPYSALLHRAVLAYLGNSHSRMTPLIIEPIYTHALYDRVPHAEVVASLRRKLAAAAATVAEAEDSIFPVVFQARLLAAAQRMPDGMQAGEVAAMEEALLDYTLRLPRDVGNNAEYQRGLWALACQCADRGGAATDGPGAAAAARLDSHFELSEELQEWEGGDFVEALSAACLAPPTPRCAALLSLMAEDPKELWGKLLPCLPAPAAAPASMPLRPALARRVVPTGVALAAATGEWPADFTARLREPATVVALPGLPALGWALLRARVAAAPGEALAALESRLAGALAGVYGRRGCDHVATTLPLLLSDNQAETVFPPPHRRALLGAWARTHAAAADAVLTAYESDSHHQHRKSVAPLLNVVCGGGAITAALARHEGEGEGTSAAMPPQHLARALSLLQDRLGALEAAASASADRAAGWSPLAAAYLLCALAQLAPGEAGELRDLCLRRHLTPESMESRGCARALAALLLLSPESGAAVDIDVHRLSRLCVNHAADGFTRRQLEGLARAGHLGLTAADKETLLAEAARLPERSSDL